MSAFESTLTFDDDDRIHFSKETKTWRLENDDGSEFEWDTAKRTWVPVLDDDLLKLQQAAYSVSGVDESTPAAPVLARETKKRKKKDADVDYTSSKSSTKRNRTATPITITATSHSSTSPPPRPPPPRSKNTAIFITNLPPDTTSTELHARFSKCGVIEETDKGDPKIKLYPRNGGDGDDGGGLEFSGDALVVYFKEESVELAVRLLDEAELRLGDPTTRMRVKQAEFEKKKDRAGGVERADGETKRTVDKKKATRRIGKMQRKLTDWDDDDDFGPSPTTTTTTPHPTNTNARVVVLKHMFTLKELDDDPSLLLDLREDVREECSTLGEVTNVVLYDKEPEGVMTVKFRDPVSAMACLIKMHGRYFAGRQVEATLYTGKHHFRRSGTTDDIQGTDEDAEKKRLDNFAQWLMSEGD